MLNVTAIAQAARQILSEVNGTAGAEPSEWPYGDAEFSPPDAYGFVRSRSVELGLVAKYGPTIAAGELTVDGVKTNLIDVPRLFHVKEADLGDAPQGVRDIVEVSTASAAFNQNRPRIDLRSGYAIDRGIRMAVPKAWPWSDFIAALDKRLGDVAQGNAFHAYGLREDERPAG